ncbi:Sulfate permease 2 [Yamadazyma tenuis]|uniref:Sulfate permease n=1 Tax=Candida tenuis (strain ATCC 10573 / BCRC 21748 / CBS 615 / JCM 9827 / NBRC 10315 / NRRL Y-1498 / VKM Y-70) TaxID=590646 RepID=G3B1Y1_CANTC|nr:sulfate permease [Yamadazyma tenuis ATCC 10573]EGV64559.1 sulfate permease [Yamadazyma tenuis ATCC 10573]WEJ97323.1 Sulfate permease 2 [Yamadazyma tenuis]
MAHNNHIEDQEPELFSVASHLSHVASNPGKHQYEIEEYQQGSSNVVVPEYHESEITVVDYGKSVFANPVQKFLHYLISLFPIAKWILHYNGRWLYGDLVAGITVGIVLVPQSMSYAILAGLPAQYGLYSSFVGVFIYSFFATSKDVSIGPVAVMSTQVGKVVAKVLAANGDRFTAPEIATFMSLICGGIAAGIGILRLGFILEFISVPAVMGFMTGSAFNILTGQVPALMGYGSSVNTRDSTYLVVINSLKNLPNTTVDAAFGLVGLFILYTWKWFTEFGQKRWPKYKLWFFYVQCLRNAIVLIVSTAICWGVVHPKLKAWSGPIAEFVPPVKILGTVPSGLRHVGVMKIPHGIMGEIGSEIPASTIILLLEHVAIAKSFGRVNDYKIIPDQELVAIGVNNLIGTFFAAYPATGSFSRSALKNKCGVRTPLAGIFTGAVVLLALYTLTDTFYYIPKATLSAVIIHAVSDLMAHYKTTWNFWKIAPIDAGIFLIAVIICVFSTIEIGIYFAISASAAVLLFRVAMPNGEFLGKVKVAEVINPIIDSKSYDNSKEYDGSGSSSADSFRDVEIHQVLSNNSDINKKKQVDQLDTSTKQLLAKNPNIKFHTRWVPLSTKNVNKNLDVQLPPDGVLVFKPIESFTYPNASRQIDKILDYVKKHTRRGRPYPKDKGSRPWNDPGPLEFKLPWSKKQNDVIEDVVDDRPVLRIVHFDFSTVASTDVTGIQTLVDLRKSLNIYTDREVEFHFSGILSPWIRRGLLNAGFGSYENNALVSNTTYVNIATDQDLEADLDSEYFSAVSTDTPFFHLDIPDY